MSIQIDWAKMIDSLPEEAPKRDLIPPDVYTVKVSKAEAGMSKKGNGKIDLTLTVDEGKYKDRVVWGRINFAKDSPVSMSITMEQLAQFGVTRQWLARENPSNAQIALKLVGERLTVKVSHREWEGSQYYDVKGYKALDNATSDPF